MGSDDLRKLDTWIEALHAVHEDMRVNTGGYISCRFVAIQVKASK